MPTCQFCGQGFTATRPDAKYCAGRCRLAAKRQRDRQRRVIQLQGFSHAELDEFEALAVTGRRKSQELIRQAYFKHGLVIARLVLQAVVTSARRE
jgi:predicted nucleic acid-binding Zn ribbon protein